MLATRQFLKSTLSYRIVAHSSPVQNHYSESSYSVGCRPC